MSVPPESEQQYTHQSVMPIWHARLGRQLSRLAKPVLQQKQHGLFSITLEAPLASPTAPPRVETPWVFWHRPAENHKLAGLGEAMLLTAEGKDRFLRLQNDYAGLQQSWTRISEGKIKSQPRAFLGYAFDAQQPDDPMWRGFSASQLLIPSLLIEWLNGRCTLTFSCAADTTRNVDTLISYWLDLVADTALAHNIIEQPIQALQVQRSDAEEANWLQRVETALQAIRRGEIEKLVLSRYLTSQADRQLSVQRMFASMQQQYPNCTLIGANFAGGSLVAATPERLFSVRGGEVTVDALAGTVAAGDMRPRLEMQTYEHAPVVSAIQRALTGLCQQVQVEQQSDRMQLGNLQHLWTTIKGQLNGRVNLFQLLDELHPTPAVGGVPTDQACAWIGGQENWRGWYTGGFGWIGDNREGDLSVLLRCALIDGKNAQLFAGAGITRVSNPLEELSETQLKFDAMLGALMGRS